MFRRCKCPLHTIILLRNTNTEFFNTIFILNIKQVHNNFNRNINSSHLALRSMQCISISNYWCSYDYHLPNIKTNAPHQLNIWLSSPSWLYNHISHCGDNFLCGSMSTISPAILDITPNRPTVPGDNLTCPKAFKGMKKSHTFLTVSIITALSCWTQSKALLHTVKHSCTLQILSVYILLWLCFKIILIS